MRDFFFFKKEVWNLKIWRGGRIIFWNLRQSLNFPQISKQKASACSEELFPYGKNNKYIYIYIYKYIFIIFSIRGLLLRTSWCHPFWNLRKIERLTRFQKKLLLPPPYFQISDLFFEKKKSLNFSPITKKKAQNCSQEQSPYRQI